jgi:hypothetical protein
MLLVASLAAAAFAENSATFEFPNRIADLDADCYSKTDAAAAIEQLEADFAATKESLEGDMEAGVESVNAAQTALREAIKEQMETIEEAASARLAELEAELTETKEALESSVEQSIANLTKSVSESLAKYQLAKLGPVANDTTSPKWKANYALVQMAKAPANTENGHAGRMMYKIEYNPNSPGYFHPGGPELKDGCRALSADLKAIDNIDRDLKPAADVDWASDGDSVRLQGSYLSNCGCGGHPRQRQCVGMSNNFLRGGVMYNRYHSWWGCRYLRHDGRDCHHHWSDCYGRWGVKGDYTVCTSANDKYKV